MELNDLFGLPAHPLIVHAAVVLLPLAALGTVVVAAVPKARRHYAPVVLAVSLLATAAIWLAQQSGESLEERVTETPLVERHTDQAETVLPWAVGVTVLAGAVWAADVAARRDARLAHRGVGVVLLTAALVASTGAVWTIVNVGHSGAKATWSEVSNGGG